MVDEFTDRAGFLNDLTNGLTHGREVKAGDERGDLRAQLDQETLSIGTGDLEDVLDLGDVVANDHAVTLEVLADSGDDRADGNTDTGEAEAREEASEAGGKLDKEIFAALADNCEETLNGTAEVLDEVTDRAGAGDDGADGGADSREAELRKETGNLRAELNEEAFGVGASDLKDVLDLRANVMQKLSAGTGGGLAGDAADGGASTGDGEVKRLGNGLEVLGDPGGSSHNGGGKGREGSDVGSLHCDGSK